MNYEISCVPNRACGSFEQYLATIKAVPLLGEKEEYELARRFREKRDRLAAERLVVSHLRLVLSIARRYSGYGLPLPDLVQEGAIGLMRAVRRFDPAQGVRLAAFAAYHIHCDIREFVLKNWRLVKVATTKAQRKLFFNLRKTRSRLGWMSDEEMQDIASFLAVRPEEVREMQSRMLGYDLSLSEPLQSGTERDDGSRQLLELPEPSAAPEDQVSEQESRSLMLDKLRSALGGLDERSRDIVTRRWLGRERVTLQDLALQYGISKERIRQIESRAMTLLRQEVEAAA